MFVSTKNGQTRLIRPIFLYDADCGVCTQTVGWLKERGAGIALEFAACQMRPELLERFHLSDSDCRKAAWVVEPRADGVRLHRGAAAINFGLRSTAGRSSLGWRLLGRLYPLPVIRQFEDLGYTWFARNRHRFARGPQVCSVEGM